MTTFKHWQLVIDPSYGLLHRLAMPFRMVEMFFLPIASWIVLGYIVWLLMTGFALQVLALLVFFTSIVFLIAALGVQIEGEDWRLLVYTPLLVIGYKQFHDALNIKCLVDVLRKQDLSWTNAKRIEQGRERADTSGSFQDRP